MLSRFSGNDGSFVQLPCRCPGCAGAAQTGLVRAIDPLKLPTHDRFAQMIKIGGTLALWLFGAAFVVAGVNIHEPYVNFLHGAAVAILLLAGFVVYVLFKRGYW